MKRIFCFFTFVLLVSCNPVSEKNEIQNLELFENLNISSPSNFGGGMSASFIFQDTLGYFLPTKPKDKIFIVDLKSREFIDEIELDPNFITYPSGIQVVSPDSIFVSDFQFPIIYLMNQKGEILESFNLYRENLWEMPKEGFANFGLYFGFGLTFKYLPERNSFLIPLKQLDQWYFIDEKKNFPAIAEYDLSSKEFKNQFGKYEGIYGSDENSLLPFYLSHPIVEEVNGKVILSFSMDPNLYIYNLEGEFLEKKSATISQFKLGAPLEYNMDDFDSEGLFAFNKRNSYFGNFFYVKEQEKFVRIFLECIPDSEGNCVSKKVYAMVFDKELNLIEVSSLPETFSKDFFTYQIGFEDGFISKVSSLESDDEFSLNHYYSID